MENPVNEIPAVIHLLTQSSPSIQRETIEKYFTPDASFTHPFCRTGKWQNSRLLIAFIYRWYKIMSPRIDISVQSVAFDEKNLILYTTIFQVFRLWLVPFYYAPVQLTCVIRLERSPQDKRYYITSQDDLYAIDQWVRFVAPGAWLLVYIWQFWATAFCVLGCWILWPVSWVEEKYGWGEGWGPIEGQRKRGRGWEGKDGRPSWEVIENTRLRGRLIG